VAEVHSQQQQPFIDFKEAEATQIRVCLRGQSDIAGFGHSQPSVSLLLCRPLQIRAMREECALEGRPPKPLIYVRTADKLATVVRTLFEHKCSMAPILSADHGDNPGSPLPSVLHIATLSGVLNCLMRHFRASLASLPLLALPLSQLPIGTWAPEQQFVPGPGFNPALGTLNPGSQQQQQVAAHGQVTKQRSSSMGGDGSDSGGGGDGVIVGRKVTPLHAVTPSTPLTNALGLLLEAGVSATGEGLDEADCRRGAQAVMCNYVAAADCVQGSFVAQAGFDSACTVLYCAVPFRDAW
jgi:hypothetical protein